MNVVLVPARVEDAFVLSTTMREKDVAELDACALTPLGGLLQSLRVSEVAYTALYDDVVGAMLGVEPVQAPGTIGRMYRLWFLTGHLFAERPIAFVKAARRVLAQLRTQYPVLFNVIDARHDDALKFAQSLGAELFPPVPVGPMALPFVPFRIGGR